MAKRVLFCATVDYHFKAFHLPYMKWFKEQGWTVDIAASGNTNLPYTDNKFTIPMERSPFRRNNWKAYQKLKKIIMTNNYSIIHCHTPLGGVLARCGARHMRRSGAKVIYTAHGFHFCKGAPLMNWLIYYPIERFLARYTDHLITINQEDFNLAKSHRFKAKSIGHVAGVGVDTERFQPVTEQKKRETKRSFGYKSDDFLLFNVGEFNKNKNQKLLLYMMREVIKHVPNARLLLAGEGELLEECQVLAEKLGISNVVEFLHFRKDIDRLLHISDVVLGSSFREGLPVNILEAMASGLPVITGPNRGYKELVHKDVNGFIMKDWDYIELAQKVNQLACNDDLRKQFGMNGRKMIIERYSVEQTLKQMKEIYKANMTEQEDKTWAIL